MKLFLHNLDILIVEPVKKNFALFAIELIMGKLSVLCKRNNKLLISQYNVLSVNQIGLRSMDAIMCNAKFAIINFAINVRVLLVELIDVTTTQSKIDIFI